MRVLLLVTFRPEFASPWIGRLHVTALTINRLAPHEVSALIDGVAGDRPLGGNIRRDIDERADGIPLFVEEMTKAVLEAEGEGGARTVAGAPSPALAVPASLHASLMARLDRLGPAKGVAKIGAAIGREFSHALLAFVARVPEPELAAALDRLIQAGAAVPPRRPAACDVRLQARAGAGRGLRHVAAEPRRALHARIAEDDRNPIPGDRREPAGTAGPTLDRGGPDRKGRRLWGKAGQWSLARSALVEAEAQLTRALRPNRVVAGHPGLAPRADQASGRACERTDADQGLCGAASTKARLNKRAL